jgi:ribose transport system substrate-binding protein
MKKIFVLVLIAAMLFSLAACATNATSEGAAASGSAAGETAGNDAAAGESAAAPAPSASLDEDAPYIIMVNAIVGHPVYEQQAEAARQAAADYGVKFEIIGPAMGSSDLLGETVNCIDNAIALHPDAIITEPWDSTLNASINKIHEAGIPNFCTSNVPDNEENFIAWIGTDNYNYGVTAADMLAEKTGGKANVCMMMSMLAATNQLEQIKGFEETIAQKYPDIKVIVKEADNADAATAVTKFEEVFNAYPEINAVVMLESTGGPSAAQVATEMNKDVLILDIDAVDQTIDNIKKGTEWATLAQNFYKRGYESVRMAAEYLENGNADSFEKYNDSGCVLIDSSNVETYKEDLEAAIIKKGTPMK